MVQPPDRNWGPYLSVGFEMAGAVGLGCLLGWWIDGRWNTGPWGLVIGAILGVASGMYLLIRGAVRMNK